MSLFIGNNSNTSVDYQQRGIKGSYTDNNVAGTFDKKGSITLQNGQTVTGKVIDIDGKQITLKLDSGETVSARLEGGADIFLGARLAFETVKGSSNQTILRPLYANLSSDSFIGRAITQAGLELNNTTAAFTSAMMEEGMSVSKNALIDMSKQVALYPNTDPANIVKMVKIGIPIDDINVTQFENYTNFEHSIVSDVGNMAEGITDTLIDLFGDRATIPDGSNINNAVNQLLDLVDLDGVELLDAKVATSAESQKNVGSLGTNIASDAFMLNENLSLNKEEQIQLLNDINGLLEFAGKENAISEPVNAKEVITTLKELINDQYNGEAGNEVSLPDDGDVNLNSNSVNQSKDLINVLGNKTNEAISKNEIASEALKNKIVETTANGDNNVPKEQVISEKIASFVKSEPFTKLFKDSFKAQFELKPEDIAKDGKITELYERISKQTSKVNDFLNSINQQNSDASKSATNLSNNVKFMNQLNEFLNYVQLPLKMAGEEAHGELYVYTKKKNLSNNDGNFSALLHLDMEHLGPMDVHVAMQNYTKVNTHFYLQDDALMDFINEHIDELTARLNKLGYSATSMITKKDTTVEASPIIEEFLKDEDGNKSNPVVSKLCFDVRA